METSILNSTKKNLGIVPEMTEFDDLVITHINTAFSTLYQLGVGPAGGFAIEDPSLTWDDFIEGDISIVNACKTYVYLRVRLLFDPPATSFTLSAMQEQLKEYEWRISVLREEASWTSPTEVV